MSNLESVSTNVEPFKLKSSSNDFAQKMSSVFGSLDDLEKRHEEWQVNKGEENLKLLKSDPLDQDEAPIQQDNFKKPQIQPPRKRQYHNAVPDFKKHPEKWTKYTLMDVPGKDISDAGNQEAAFSFLEEMRQRRDQDYASTPSVEDGVDTLKPVIFGVRNQSSRLVMSDDDTESTSSKHAMVQGNKFIMPECVVGMTNIKPSKKNTNRVSKELSDKSVHLDHLDEQDVNDSSEEDDDVGMPDADPPSLPSIVSEEVAEAKTKIRALRRSRCDDD